MKSIRIGICLALCQISALGWAEDWPRFRGPDGAGTSASTLPVSWTPDANLAWKVALPGPGVSSPIVVGNSVFVTCYSGYGVDRENPGDIQNLRRHLVCLDAVSGEERWRRTVAAAQPEDPYDGVGIPAHGYASHTPVSDGERVYVYFGKSGALAFDLAGKQLWQTSVGTESDPWAWGSASSPIVYKDLLIVTAAPESQALVGLDKSSGKEVWRQEATGLDGMWGTPTLVKIDSTRTDLVMSVPREMWGLDPRSGKLRWYCDATEADSAHSSPISGGGKVIAFTGRGGGSVAVKAGGRGDVTTTNVVWKGRDSARFGSPVSDGDFVYLVANGVLTVIDPATGDSKKRLRLEGGGSRQRRGRFGNLDYPSPIIAGDKLYYVNGRGVTFVFTLGPEPKQLSVNLVTTDDESFGGTPAISDNRMYLRSSKHLYCVTDQGDDAEPNASSPLIAAAGPEEEAGNEGGRRGVGRGGRRRGFDPEEIFRRRDANQDGQLTADELAGSPMADRLADIDQNGDQAITLEEFRAGARNVFGRRPGGRGRGGPRGRGRRGEDNRPERSQRPQSDT